MSEDPPPTSFLSTLILANHILHHHGLLDSYGHVSARSPTNPSTFFIAHNVAPALVSSPTDLHEFKVDDGAPVDPESKIGWSERYIHSEIYKRFADVGSVVHSHSSEVLPFTVSSVPLRPVYHMAGFLSGDVPVWDISSAYTSSHEKHDMLVRDAQLAASLAAAFSKSSGFAGSMYSKVSSTLMGSSPPDAPTYPDHPVVLMRGHGMTVVGKRIEEAVYQAVYAQEAAVVQRNAMVMREAWFENSLEGTIPKHTEGGGKISGGKVKNSGPEMHWLSGQETADTWGTNRWGVPRAWRLWEREVKVNPLYENEVRTETKE